jgi:hypothetical protein
MINLAKISEQLTAIRKLEDNWDSYGADKISESVIVKTESIINELIKSGLEIYHISPTSLDSICIELQKDILNMEIYVSDEITEFYLFENDLLLLTDILDIPRISQLMRM